MKKIILISLLLAYAVFSLLYFMPIDIPHKIAIPMTILAIGACFARNPLLVGACIFSALGDYSDFVPKMCFFAGAQVFYILLFVRIKTHPQRRNWFLDAFFMLAWLVVLFFFLRWVDVQVLRWGVAAYSGLLILMCRMACASGCIWSVVGGLLFLVSDSVLGISHFVWRLLYSNLLVMIPYYLGQLLLFVGFLKQSGTIVNLWHVHKSA